MRSKKNNICGFIRIWFVAEFNAILFNTVCPSRSNIESAVIWNSSCKINEKKESAQTKPTKSHSFACPRHHRIISGEGTLHRSSSSLDMTWPLPPRHFFHTVGTHTHTHIIQTRPSNPLHSFTLLESWECSYLLFFFSSALILARHLKVEKSKLKSQWLEETVVWERYWYARNGDFPIELRFSFCPEEGTTRLFCRAYLLFFAIHFSRSDSGGFYLVGFLFGFLLEHIQIKAKKESKKSQV